ncbi:MAG: lipopolysaccharide biosynthesis protein [Paracoccaceae bacterium]
MPGQSGAEGAGRFTYAHPSSGRSRAAVRGVLWSSLHTAVPTLSAAVVFFFAARYLAPVDFGTVGLAASIVAFAVALAPGALGEALIQRKAIDDAHTDSVFWLTTGVGLLLFTTLCLGAGWIATLLGEPALRALLPVIGLRIPFELAATVPNALIVRSMRFRLVALRTSIATAISMSLCLALLFLGYGYWALAISQVAVSMVNCVAAYWVTGWRPGRELRAEPLRQLMSYGIFASGTRMLSLMNLDQILIGVLGGAPMLGFYYFARRLFVLLNGMIAGSLSSVSHVLLSALQSDGAKVRQALLFATYASSVVAFPVFTGIALIIDDLIPMAFGEKWMAAALPIQAFCVIGVLASIGIVQAALVTSQGRAGWWFLYQLVQQATTLAVIWAFADDFQAMMVAIAVKTLLLWPISIRMTTRLLGCGIAGYLRAFAAPVAATCVMAAGVLAVPYLLPGLGPAVFVPLQIVTGVLLYVPVIFALSLDRIGDLRRLIASKGL